jgi:acyl dehydratase
MAAELYLEDFHPGDRVELGSKVMDEADIIRFAKEFDPQVYHTDPAAAKNTPFGGLVASGWHTGAVVMRLFVDAVLGRTAAAGGAGCDDLRWLLPVRVGDTLTAFHIVDTVRPSASKPDRGLVTFTWEAYNQNGQKVMTMHGPIVVLRRPTA